MQTRWRMALLLVLSVTVAGAATRPVHAQSGEQGGGLIEWMETVAGGVIGHLTGPGGEIGFHLLVHPCETYWGSIASAVRAEEIESLSIMAADPLGRTQAGRDAAARQRLLRALSEHWLAACQGSEAARAAIRAAIQEFQNHANGPSTQPSPAPQPPAPPPAPAPPPPPVTAPGTPPGGMPGGGAQPPGGSSPKPTPPPPGPLPGSNPDAPGGNAPDKPQAGGVAAGGAAQQENPVHDLEVWGFGGWGRFDPAGINALPLQSGQVRTMTLDVLVRNNTNHPDMGLVSLAIGQVTAGCGVAIGTPPQTVAVPPGGMVTVPFQVSFLCEPAGIHKHAVELVGTVIHLGAADTRPANNQGRTHISVLVQAP